ncbi:Monoglucosyldiacylglycerol epimerase [Lasiodiplodia theobromae]|uniref:Monoglucosyldiacylglycerol epimerase n=1 Tax=Lasiodiplodia theobromae TaxID=45133 RepID=A0A5N5CY84_9PEZI|nr:Monoglucosyldiacylglycerol epimerase [Lasiodiplodia theobromae]
MPSISTVVPIPLFSLSQLIHNILFGITHFFVGSVLYDFVHWIAHNSERSSSHTLRYIARIHRYHHVYFDRNLKFNKAYSVRNVLYHLSLELICQIVGSTLSWLFSRLLVSDPRMTSKQGLILVLAIQTVRSIVVAWNEGHDSNHIPYTRVPKDPHFLFVGPEYHALHHVDPQNYFGSMVRVFDWVFGTAVTLRNRRVAMTGSGGALGQALTEQLALDRVKCIKPLQFGVDWTYDNYAALAPILADTDVLILAHGTKDADSAMDANCKAAVAMVELFKRVHRESSAKMLPEVWYVGSEAEFHGSWTDDMRSYTDSKRAFVPHARAYYEDDSFIYRHIVPAAFASKMGPALVSAQWAAKTALWWIHRGARYVPVTYTGFAFANYFRFMYWVTPHNGLVTAGDASVRSRD